MMVNTLSIHIHVGFISPTPLTIMPTMFSGCMETTTATLAQGHHQSGTTHKQIDTLINYSNVIYSVNN